MLQRRWIYPRLAAAFTVASLALGGCERTREVQPSRPAPAVETPAVAPSPPLPPPPLGRSELLAALDAARSAYAAGQPAPDQGLAGRRFSIREAFGCAGAFAWPEEDGVAHWAWGPRQETIEISLTPADWTSELIVGDDALRWEAAEGFWLTHPWLRTGDCPAAHEGGAAPPIAKTPKPPPRRTDGLAAVFERGGSRVGRRAGKAFSVTIRDGAELGPPAAGYRLVIEGRLSAFASGRAIRCRAPGPHERPLCVAAATVDRVAIESADGKLLNEWRMG